MRTIPCTYFFLLLWLLSAPLLKANNGTPVPKSGPPNGGLNPEVIKLRLKMMDCPVKAEYNADVAAYLRRYLTYGKKDTERMLTEGKLYFPIFEHYLELYGMPRQLKYLPMIESSMVPYSVSYAGAAGLWQFMPATGRYMGLTIDNYLDERKDPYKATEAAVQYLKKLYKRFGTWELALAAYNCGPTRLSRTIRAYGSKDYWKIKNGLPRETRKYVNRYVAACYAGTYHNLHGIRPGTPALYHLQPMAARIYSQVSLRSIARLTGIDLRTLRMLNPAFVKDYTPARPKGVFLVLPRESWYTYLDYKSKQSRPPLAARP
ncbi:MAG TPA: hypothetical protein ENJ20_04615 [Bacteroidetes bacterium]|nr:hypothetical protein [Bacteroidota bacterium]